MRELAETYTIAECTFDPWRFEAPALELAERGIPIVAFPQSNARMAPASGRLHAAIVEKRLQHPDDSALNATSAPRSPATPFAAGASTS